MCMFVIVITAELLTSPMKKYARLEAERRPKRMKAEQ